MNDDLPRNETPPSPGEDLYGLSVDELKVRIDIYHAEVARLTKELARKEKERDAAELLFKPKA